jgi:hypothetical protein
MLAKIVLLSLYVAGCLFAPMWGIFGGCEAAICAGGSPQADQAPAAPNFALAGVPRRCYSRRLSGSNRSFCGFCQRQ